MHAADAWRGFRTLRSTAHDNWNEGFFVCLQNTGAQSAQARGRWKKAFNVVTERFQIIRVKSYEYVACRCLEPSHLYY